MKNAKTFRSEATALNVIPFQVGEQMKRETALGRSIEDLVDVMRELILVEKLTGRSGLPQRVYIAFSNALMSAMRLAGCENDN